MMEIEKFKRKPKEQELERISTNLEDLNAKTKELQKKIEALENQGKQADAPPPPPVEVPPVAPPMQGRNALCMSARTTALAG